MGFLFGGGSVLAVCFNSSPLVGNEWRVFVICTMLLIDRILTALNVMAGRVHRNPRGPPPPPPHTHTHCVVKLYSFTKALVFKISAQLLFYS